MPTTPKLLAPIQLAGLIVKPIEARSAGESETIVRIKQDAEAATLVRLVRRFVDLVRDAGVTGKRHHTGVDTFDAWLAEACDCGVRAVATFAAELKQDGAAVHATLTFREATLRPKGRSPS